MSSTASVPAGEEPVRQQENADDDHGGPRAPGHRCRGRRTRPEHLPAYRQLYDERIAALPDVLRLNSTLVK